MISRLIFLLLLVHCSVVFARTDAEMGLLYLDVIASSGSQQSAFAAVKVFNAALAEMKLQDKEHFQKHYQALQKTNLNSFEKFDKFYSAQLLFAKAHNSTMAGLSVLESNKSKNSPEKTMFNQCVVLEKAVYKIYYINGMFNDTTDLLNSIEAIQNLEQDFRTNRLKANNNTIEYMPLYNDSEMAIHQLAQVVKDKLVDDFAIFWDYYYQLETAPEWFQKDYLDQAVEMLVKPFRNEPMSSDFSSSGVTYGQIIYNDMVLGGKIPIIVAHSQGGLLANAATRYINSRLSREFEDDNLNYVASILLGSPVSHHASNVGATILRNDDFIMKLVRWTAGTLDPNFKDLVKSADKNQHNFIMAYLQNSKIKKEFTESIKRSISELLPYSSNKIYGVASYETDCFGVGRNVDSTFQYGMHFIEELDRRDSPNGSFFLKCREFQSPYSEGYLRSELEITLYSSPAEERASGSCNMSLNIKLGNGSSTSTSLTHEFSRWEGGDRDEKKEFLCLTADSTTISTAPCN